MPAVNPAGDVTYSGYTSSGYKIFHLQNTNETGLLKDVSYVRRINPPMDNDNPNGDIDNFDISSLENFDDKRNP